MNQESQESVEELRFRIVSATKTWTVGILLWVPATIILFVYGTDPLRRVFEGSPVEREPSLWGMSIITLALCWSLWRYAIPFLNPEQTHGWVMRDYGLVFVIFPSIGLLFIASSGLWQPVVTVLSIVLIEAAIIALVCLRRGTITIGGRHE